MSFRRTCESVPRFLGRLRRRRSHSCSSLSEVDTTNAKSRTARLGSSSASSASLAPHNRTAYDRETISYHPKRADFSNGSLLEMPPLPGAIDHGAGKIPSLRISAPVSYRTLPPLPARSPPKTPPRTPPDTPPGPPAGIPPLPRWGNYMCNQITSVAIPSDTIARSPPKRLQGIPNSSPISITVVSAVTGEFLAEVALPSTASVASLKLEIEKATARPAFSLRFLREAGGSMECCCQDFDSLEVALGGTVPVTLALVLSQPNLDSSSYALPFDAKEREYLPASGLVDSALQCQYRP